MVMAEEGPAGRFNRAQRGFFNIQEKAPWIMAFVILNSAATGPLGFALGVQNDATQNRGKQNELNTRSGGASAASPTLLSTREKQNV